MNMRANLTMIGATALLAACNSADEPADQAETAQSPTPQLTSSPTPTQAADGTPLAAGSWSITETADGASATFAQTNAEPQIEVSCNAATRTLSMQLPGSASGVQPYVLESGGTAARLDMTQTGDADAPHMAAEIALDAPVFGGFVQPGGIIQITYPGGNILRVPSAPGIRRIFEACA